MTVAPQLLPVAAARTARADRLSSWMRHKGLDHLLLTAPDQIRYATDYRAQLVSESTDWYAAVVDADGEAEIFVPFTDHVMERPEPAVDRLRRLHPAPSWAPAACQPRQWVTGLSVVLRARGARRVGFDVLDAALLHDLWTDLPRLSFLPCAAELFTLRAVKDDSEIQLIDIACRINTAALDKAVQAAQPGMRDHDLLAVAAEHQHSLGAEFLTHSVCNIRKGSGSWFADGAPLREGEPFFLDTGCHGPGGYASDAARTGFLGEPPPAVSRAWSHLLTAYEEGRNAARPGVRCSTVHDTMNAYLLRHDLPPTPYGTGHGVGLRCCELPSVNAATRMDTDDTLRVGHVIALEPETAVEVEGRLMVLKIEDNFAVTPSGLRCLTRATTSDDSAP
ncbi:M24 family metallopeptidase [Streptomyces argenteolus]|uniref:M24 family metallopeptidase n=1 Tax=Streptomyces argenteolus TaxID=67274 RepID=A0ABW6XGK1_9ACTN